MLDNFLTVSSQVVVLFILIGIGFVCGKTKFLSSSTTKNLTNIVLYFVTPCVIIEAFNRDFDINTLTNLGITAIIAITIHILSISLATLIFRDKKKEENAILKFSTIFSNCGFMSIPLQKALLGDDGVFYGAVFIAVFNLVIWSYGATMMSGDRKNITPKKLILNPGVIGVTLGLIIFIFSIKLPFVISSPISYMSHLNTPLPMLIIGFHLSRANLLGAFKYKKQYIAIGLRLLVIPLLSLLIMYVFKVDSTIMIACLIAASAPTAATTTMFAEKFNKDTTLSVNIVSLSTIFSIATMPFIVALAQMI